MTHDNVVVTTGSALGTWTSVQMVTDLADKIAVGVATAVISAVLLKGVPWLCGKLFTRKR